ncbi:unnamed protein product [Rangifer tarandus platyrhynchus]|uniref:Uncharacterized protein n=1 Tax=Rangifer tarandus platyrhynchus TaxID=3082113 RepID=A0ABN8YAA7_RANTA|nr:unnamed protein product [Rangifer tarandus platyrhynchus]CAI9158326.1 unnamed protein product [Rangifer tarandus platyrhynchus]
MNSPAKAGRAASDLRSCRHTLSPGKRLFSGFCSARSSLLGDWTPRRLFGQEAQASVSLPCAGLRTASRRHTEAALISLTSNCLETHLLLCLYNT